MSVNSPILSEHKALTEFRISDLKEHLASGRCKSFDDYKRITGTISGLNESLEIMNEAKKAYLKDDFED